MNHSMTSAEYRASAKPKRSKYNAKRTEVDGIKFASRAEAARWVDLKQMEREGKITGLVRQKRFALHAPQADSDSRIGAYVCDFAYFAGPDWIIEDVKGMRTPLSDWKIRHTELQYGIKILITGPASKPKRSKR